MKGEYFVVELKPSMPPPHKKISAKICKHVLVPPLFTNMGHGPITYLDGL